MYYELTKMVQKDVPVISHDLLGKTGADDRQKSAAMHEFDYAKCYARAMFQAAFPDEYAQFDQIWDEAGDKRFIGPFLGLAVLWNTNTANHIDANDFFRCITMVFGKFFGGEMIFPQLDLVFK